MNSLTIAIGAISTIISLFCWYFFLNGVWNMVRTIRIGGPAPDRWFPFIPRFAHMLKEFIAHTRMVRFRTVGWAHWLVMVGFLLGAAIWFEAYGQCYDPNFAWPIIGRTYIWLFLDELLGLGTTIGIIVLMIIRQLNHPRVPERLSRFAGSDFTAAYFVEFVVLLEGLGMIFVKTFKIASSLETPPFWTSFFTETLAQVFMGIPAIMASFAAVIKLLSGMIWLLVVGKKITWGVAWHRFAAFFNIYFKREADGSTALGALKPMYSDGKVLNLEEADPEVDAFGAGKIEDFSWKDLLDFTTCTECGRCQSQCPAWNTGKPLSPKLLITSLRDHAYAKAPYILAGGQRDASGEEIGLVDSTGAKAENKLAKIPQSALLEADRPLIGTTEFDPAVENMLGGILDPEVLWSCTTCGACVEQCPVDIEHVDHIVDLRRYQVLIESEFPQELSGLFKNLENKGNPWGQNSSTRNNWINEVDFPVPVWGKDVDSFTGFEYLFWVGCAGAFEDNAKKTTKAVAELLNIAAVPFLVLADGETCTGDSARRAGNELLFQTLATQNIETFSEVFSGVETKKRKIVVTCAHCFNTLNNEYPQLGAVYQVVHHTQLLNRLVREKRLIPVATPAEENITYHDPCYLGRHNKIYAAPRELVSASGATLNEMPRHGERSMCCGAGGARMWMEETIGKRINLDRVDEALSVEPQKIATGCPFCKVMLTDGATSRAESPGTAVEVVDVAQMLLEAVHRGLPKVEIKLGGIEKASTRTAPHSAGKDSTGEIATTETKLPSPTDTTAEIPKTQDSSQTAKTDIGNSTTTQEKPSAQESASTTKQASSAPAKPTLGLKISGGRKPGAATKSSDKTTTPSIQQSGNKSEVSSVSDHSQGADSSLSAVQVSRTQTVASRERLANARALVGLPLIERAVAPGSAHTGKVTTITNPKNTETLTPQETDSAITSMSTETPSIEVPIEPASHETPAKTEKPRVQQYSEIIDLNAADIKGLRIKLGARKPGSA